MKHLFLLCVYIFPSTLSNGFVVPGNTKFSSITKKLWVSKEQDNIDSMMNDDDLLLKTVPRDEFMKLCKQLGLPLEGSKRKMLQNLRDHASKQAALDEEMKKKRKDRIEQGFYDEDSEKARYEIVNKVVDANDDDEMGYFYFSLPQNETEITATAQNVEDEKKEKKQRDYTWTTHPPPPAHLKPNEKGQIIEKVYSTKAKNDLTGYQAHSQQDSSPLVESSGVNSELISHEKKSKLPVDLEKAKEVVDELVRSLLLLSGAPGFQEEFTEGVRPLSENVQRQSFVSSNKGFVGFDPSEVDAEVLVSSSKALRAGRGSVLDQVLNEYEMSAIGHDGLNGDDRGKGGGHYREVTRVRAFLEGFRRAEVKRIARETTSLLLDCMAKDGVQGLDRMLSTMTKVTDDSGDTGDLSDATLEFLDDLIRDQERRSGKLKKNKKRRENVVEEKDAEVVMEDDDILSNLWNTTNEDGQQIETLDPQDPRVKEAFSKVRQEAKTMKKEVLPETPPERLLLLLKLLRERLKVEAAYGGANNQHGRNLRALAYCLKFDDSALREKYIKVEYGSSIDRLDSFMDLVTSSIDYAETTSAQLRPSNFQLNLPLLTEIYDTARKVRNDITSLKP